MTTRDELMMEFNKSIPNQAPPTQREEALLTAIAEVIDDKLDRWGLKD